VETTITATALAKNLSDVLNRVKYRGERFVVVRNNEPVATIGPPPEKPTITWAEFVTLLRELPRPDPEFADDLEEIQASQPPAELTEWPD
jgi:prevent-host-death family protein